ncbi:MAG: hypothetical protein ASARMPREDX12_002484 [Alectoria sarmentosa]|nr:MAG: hypothetical protein ASARMPREDX12_002484 [Alectoria sarmentosa]
MAPESDFQKILRGFERVHKEYCKLDPDPAKDLPYIGGACLAPSDFTNLNIAFDRDANTHFWGHADNNTICALDEVFGQLDTELNYTKMLKKTLTERNCPTIEDAAIPSSEYNRSLQHLVKDGLIYNDAMRNSSGDDLFQGLQVGYLWSRIYMETRLVFISPGHPHITILSIQPQRAVSRKELLCTEFWMLYYWAQKLARRALHTTSHCLPMRMVSLCGYEARVVSAVFSLGYPRSIANRPVKCQIHIAEYRNLSVRQQVQDLMEELVATPCGNAEVQQKLPGKKGV